MRGKLMSETASFNKIRIWSAKNKKEIFFALVIFMFILATFKYVSKGETYISEIGWEWIYLV